MPRPNQETKPLYDVVVIGGSLSGAATATLLLRKNPGLKLLIVEKSTHFTRRVGEATVEVSAFFLGRILGMTQHLNESHLVKQGMRFWFTNDEVASLDQASELGGRYQVRLPSYQLDRAVFDEEVSPARLRGRRQVAASCQRDKGASFARRRADYYPSQPGKYWKRSARAGWSMLRVLPHFWRDSKGGGRQIALIPIAAAWGRWKGVKDWDGYELAQKYPEWASAPYGIRGTATNHVVGDGWWSWWIPLKGGDVSVGVVFDQRLVHWPRDGGNTGRPAEKLSVATSGCPRDAGRRTV